MTRGDRQAGMGPVMEEEEVASARTREAAVVGRVAVEEALHSPRYPQGIGHPVVVCTASMRGEEGDMTTGSSMGMRDSVGLTSASSSRVGAVATAPALLVLLLVGVVGAVSVVGVLEGMHLQVGSSSSSHRRR